jgi:hypothetical protein
MSAQQMTFKKDVIFTKHSLGAQEKFVFFATGGQCYDFLNIFAEKKGIEKRVILTPKIGEANKGLSLYQYGS